MSTITTIVNNNYKNLLNLFPHAQCLSPLSATLLFSLINHGINTSEQNSLFNSADTLDLNTMSELIKLINGRDYKTMNLVAINNDQKFTGDFENVAKTVAVVKHETFDQDYHTILNKIVSDYTSNMIQNFLTNPINGVPCVIFNVGHFKAVWKTKFNTTKIEPFTKSDGSESLVNMMSCVEKSWYYENDNIQLYYKKYEDISPNSMIFILPKEGKENIPYDINDLENHISDTDMCEIDAKVPKFKQTCTMSTNTSLPLRIVPSDSTEQFASIPFNFVQKCVVEIDEVQTCAAVATGLIAKCYVPPPQRQVSFHANRPFYYFIRNVSKQIVLFAGKYNGQE